MLESLTGIFGAAQQQRVGSSRFLERQLVKSKRLAASSSNTGGGRFGEAKGCNFDLGDVQEAVIIRYGADNDHCFLLAAILEVGGNAGERHWRAVDTGHKQAAKYDFVERGIGTASEEAVELHKKLKVHIVAGGGEGMRIAGDASRKGIVLTS